MRAWIVRAGRAGERESWALANELAGGGFVGIPDLSGARDRDEVRTLVDATLRGEPLMKRANVTGQLWALRHTIDVGDLVVMPMKTTKRLAMGVCTGGYAYLRDEPAADRRHVIRVRWQRTDVSRGSIKDDLLNTLGGAMTVFQAAKNDAAARLQTVLETGVDPGSSAAGPATGRGAGTPAGASATAGADAPDPVDPSPAPTLEVIRDRVLTHLREEFGTHKLTQLVADILRAHGYTCDVSPEGPDFGVDLIAGRGPLGLDSPTLVAEVKSEAGQIGAPVVRSLQGAMASHGADQGLLVAWGGLNRPATQAIRTDRLNIRVWDAQDVLDQLFEKYEELPPPTRARVPLTRTWVLDQEAG